jgi:hypothetical protein
VTELVACPACRRHVASRDVVCRFCTSPIVPAPRRIRGTTSRATIFAAAVLGSGCWTGSKTEPQPPLRDRADRLPAGSIRGVVRDNDTHKPLAGYAVGVMLPDGKQISTRTNARGEYSLDDLPAGRYEVQYWPANQARPRFGVSVTLDGSVGQLVDLPVYKVIETLPATPYGAPPARRRIV